MFEGKKNCSWLPLNKHAMNIWLSSLRIRAHLSWRTGKHLHALHDVLWTYSTCSRILGYHNLCSPMQPMFVEKVHNSQPFQDCTKVWMPASVPFSVPRGETTLNTAGADAPKNSRLEMFSMLKISTAKHFSQIKAICTTKTSFSLSSMQHKKMEEKNATSGSSMIFVRNVIYAQVVLFFWLWSN